MGAIVGCNFHPSYRQIAMVDTGTGEWTERTLSHEVIPWSLLRPGV
jgi:hypothetical protein